MAVRWYAAFTALAAFAFLWYAADHAGLARLPWRPAPEAGLHSALVRTTGTIDLETGKPGGARADLHWGMQAPDQPYLAAYEPQGPDKGAQIAEVGSARWEDLNDAALMRLRYAANRFSAWGPGAPVREGAVFAVRTVEGNFAKIRVAGIRRNYDLTLEWVLFARAKPPMEVKAAEIKAAEIKAADKAEAKAAVEAPVKETADACGKAIAAAQSAGAAHHALALVNCGALPGLQRSAARQTEDWLRQGVAIALKLEQVSIVAALGPREAMLKERGLRALGVFYRDQGRVREAAENFALAVDTVHAMPPPETGEHRLALRSDLHDLGLVLAQIGLRGTARQALGEAREYYLKTEPGHPALKDIDSQLQRLAQPAQEPAR